MSANVREIDAESFDVEVLAQEGPVVVDFFSTK